MTASRKVLLAVLRANSDANIRFGDLCRLVRSLGFRERIKGDHHIFWRGGVVEIINIQPRPDGKAKPYQVKQVRELIARYRLELKP